MRARVYDQTNHTYYLSEVYGIMNWGGERYIVESNEKNEQRLCLVEAVDFSTKPPYRVNIERIDCNKISEKLPWIYLGRDELSNINQTLENTYHHEALHYFSGYEYIWKQQDKLAELIVQGTIPYHELGNIKIDTKLPDWNYIENNQDIDRLMKEFLGFHDSVIKQINYITGDYVDKDGSMCLSESYDKKIQMVFDSQWSGSIEIVFEAVKVLHLVPPGENYLGDLFDASVFIKDLMIYFYDTGFDKIPESYDGTWVKALGMRWRKCDKLQNSKQSLKRTIFRRR
ncbi:MAG: hypothetical protein K2N51_06570 [Lachnospiraceae bacterium]|nr:hypothetical protein [Lachnospiraceae bacterium]